MLVLKIAAGIILAVILLSVGCSGLFVGGAVVVNESIENTNTHIDSGYIRAYEKEVATGNDPERLCAVSQLVFERVQVSPGLGDHDEWQEISETNCKGVDRE